MPTTSINIGNGLSPSIELIGDWDKADKLLRTQLPLAVKTGSLSGRKSAAEKIKKLIKKNIDRNGPPSVYWPKYSIGYEKLKARLGGNIDSMYRLSDTYYNNIKVNIRGTNVNVGLPKGIRGKRGKNPLTLGQIAIILERGSAAHNIAARPLWRPTFKEFGGKKRVAYHIVFHIRRDLFLLTGLKAKIMI